MSKINNIDIGTVEGIEDLEQKAYNRIQMDSQVGSVMQNLISYMRPFRIDGSVFQPTKATIENLQFLRRSGRICLLDLHDVSSNLIAWGKILDIRFFQEDASAELHNYQILFEALPAIGTTNIQTSEAYLIDLLYRSRMKIFEPVGSKHNPTFSTNRLDFDYEFYVKNFKSSIQTLVIESQVGDDINKVKIWGWKASAWSLIGDWGGADAWDATKAFTDDDTIAHNFKLQKGARGATLSGIGTISLKLGCETRILFSITNMQAGNFDSLSTDYGTEQLLLKIKMEHTSREALRPNPIITYIDGSVDEGVA